MTTILPPTPPNLAYAATLIQAGEVVAFPTETVYGLGANAYDETAVQKIFAAKGRPSTDPLIVHIHDHAQLDDLAVNIPPLAGRLAGQFWAGALTLILEKSARIAPSVTSGLNSVGIRMPSHPVALEFLRAAGVPICAPSANLFTRPSPTTAAHVFTDLNGRIPLILDGGATFIGVESTIVSLLTDPPTILRAGGVTLEALQAVIPTIVYQPRYLTAETASPAPGQLLKHYAPRAELIILQGEKAAVLAEIRAHYAELGAALGILGEEADLAALADVTCPKVSLGHGESQAAQRLFAALRELDEAGVTRILVRGGEAAGLGAAIWDRLYRAAEGRIQPV